MHVVDSQVHVWAPATPDRPWPPGRAHEAHRPYPVGAEALLFQMDLAGVDRAVLVPPSWEGDHNDVALEAAARYPDRFAVMGRLALDDPRSRELVEGWRGQAGMLGVRLTFHNEHNRHLLADGTADWFWPAAARAGLPVMVLAPGALDHLDRIARKNPTLRLVVDHAGVDIRKKAPEVFHDLPAVCELARYPNVAVKASGMPSLSRRAFPFEDLHHAIRALVESYGPRRTFWGTDLTRMPCTYYECIRSFTEHLTWVTEAELEWMMGRAVCEWLGWPL